MRQPAGKQEANRRRGASRQEVTGLNRLRLRRALPSRDLAATALVLAAEAAAALIVEDVNGGNSGVAIAGSTSLAAGGGVIN
jgi:hypothetical protein